MLTSQELGRPISPYTTTKTLFNYKTANPILDSTNTSNLTYLDLSALQNPGRFKNRVRFR